jgi:subtilisin family serine protease
MKKVAVMLMMAGLNLFLGGLFMYQYYDKHKETEFIVAKDHSYSGSLDVTGLTNKIGKVVKNDSRYKVVKSSKAKVEELVLPRGLIVEPIIKYSRPKPMFLSGCSNPEPLPDIPPNPNQPPQQMDWGVQRVGGQGDAGEVIVCVLDTGIDKDHPDLKYLKGYNFTTSNGSDYEDRDGHGTHTAGTVSAVDNSIGVVGSSNAMLIIGKVLSDDGYGQNNWIADGIEWCADSGADIISMSLGGPSPSYAIENALRYATDRGLWIFAAAGNESSSNVGYPAGYVMNGLYSISAMDMNDRLAYFSNYGKVEFTCPGVDILSTTPGGNYARYSGTSMATPICAGVAASYRSRGAPLKAQYMGSEQFFGSGLLTH